MTNIYDTIEISFYVTDEEVLFYRFGWPTYKIANHRVLDMIKTASNAQFTPEYSYQFTPIAWKHDNQLKATHYIYGKMKNPKYTPKYGRALKQLGYSLIDHYFDDRRFEENG